MMYDKGERRTTNGGVRAEGLVKRFGDVVALDGVDLDVPAGRVLGLLGHNGAGKTTMLRILTTLAAPTAGRAWVGGHDVVADPMAVRACIGSAGQASTVDDLLTARMNLEMIGRLYHLPKAKVRSRAEELLALVSLAEVADKRVKTFSGGMRRRLDLAAALVASPSVLFLDEPTTGLDPHARNELWALLKQHVAGGATLVLTTQYLDEADRLADDIVVLDHGKVVARGTPAELKTAHGGDRLAITLADPTKLAAARAVVAPFIAAPSAARPANARPSDARPSDARQFDARTSDARTSDARTDDARPFDSRTADARTADARTADARTSDARTADARTADSRTADARTSDARTAGARTDDARTDDARTLAEAIAIADRLPQPDPADVAAGRLVVPVRAGVRLVDIVRALDAAGVEATDLARRDATLDDVFLSLTKASSSAPKSASASAPAAGAA